MPRTGRHSARSLEARENQLIDLAIDLAEQRLRDGTASTQLICHYLKLGSSRERLEQEGLRGKNNLVKAQSDAIEADNKREERYAEAIEAMRRYSGGQNDD